MHESTRPLSAFEVNIGNTGMMMAGQSGMRCRMCK